MKKFLFMTALIFSASSMVVVAHTKEDALRPEKKLTKYVDANAHDVVNFEPVAVKSFGCNDYTDVAIPGGKLYHNEAVASLSAGYKPFVTAKARGPTISKVTYLPRIRDKDRV